MPRRADRAATAGCCPSGTLTPLQRTRSVLLDHALRAWRQRPPAPRVRSGHVRGMDGWNPVRHPSVKHRFLAEHMAEPVRNC